MLQGQALGDTFGEGKMNLEAPERQPAHDVDDNNEGDEFGDLAVGTTSLPSAVLRASLLQSPQQHGVEKADQQDGDEKAHKQDVEDENLVSGHLVFRRPLYGTGVLMVLCEEYDGEHNQEGQQPHQYDDTQGVLGGAVLHGRDGIDHGQKSVGAHHSQGERPSEPVDARQDPVDLTQRRAKDPVPGDQQCHR